MTDQNRAVAVQDAAQPAKQNAVVSFQQLERMAVSIAKSGLFAVKTPEAAMTLMLIAQAEGIPAAQAMMDYDIIEGKPAMKAAALLARFQKSGGTHRWITRTNECVSGEFSHPAGGRIVVTWDNERVRIAGLDGRQNHKKFPLQMKTARCISEAVRALAPGCAPTGMYTIEETQDMEAPVALEGTAEVVSDIAARKSLPEVEVEAMLGDIGAAPSLGVLTAVYTEACERANAVKDKSAKDAFIAAYKQRKSALESVPAKTAGGSGAPQASQPEVF